MYQFVVGGGFVKVLFWRHSLTRGCATHGKVSIVLWYRSADLEIAVGASHEISTTVGKLLEKQYGGGVREAIRGPSEALMETELETPSLQRLIRRYRQYHRPIV